MEQRFNLAFLMDFLKAFVTVLWRFWFHFLFWKTNFYYKRKEQSSLVSFLSGPLHFQSMEFIFESRGFMFLSSKSVLLSWKLYCALKCVKRGDGECLWCKIGYTRNEFCCLGELRFYTWVTFSLANKANRSRWCTTISPTSKKVIFEKMQITCLGGRIGGFEHYACGTPKPEHLCHQTSTWFGPIRKKEKFHHIHSKPKMHHRVQKPFKSLFLI